MATAVTTVVHSVMERLHLTEKTVDHIPTEPSTAAPTIRVEWTELLKKGRPLDEVEKEAVNAIAKALKASARLP